MILVLLDSPLRQNPSLISYFNNTQSPAQSLTQENNERKKLYDQKGMTIKKKAKPEAEKARTSGVMEVAKVQTYLNRIIRYVSPNPKGPC